MKSVFFALLCLLLLSPLFLTTVLACSCYSKPPIYKAYDDAEAVFVGKVTKHEKVNFIEGEDDAVENIFHFQVIEAFKGVTGKSLKINAGMRNHSCYTGFAVGETYLIYASKDEEFYYSGFCSRSEKIEQSQHQLYFIREKLKSKPESQIYGSIVRNDSSSQTGEFVRTNIQGIKVVIKSEEKRFETMTDKMGVFRFNKIPEGFYNLKLIVPDKYKIFYHDSEKILVTADKKVFGGRGIGDIEQYNSYFTEFTLGWNNKLSGKVYDADGNSVKKACVKLLPLEAANSVKDLTSPSSYRWECRETFLIDNVTPGNYVLAIEFYAPFGGKNKIRYFYPQALTAEKAQVFNIEETSQFEFDIKLPASYTVRNIEGEVVWSNGVSLGNNIAWASLKESENSNGERDWDYHLESLDASGKFVLQAFENAEYWLHVTTYVDVINDGKKDRVEVKAKPIKIKAGKNNEKLKIVLQIPEGFSGGN